MAQKHASALVVDQGDTTEANGSLKRTTTTGAVEGCIKCLASMRHEPRRRLLHRNQQRTQFSGVPNGCDLTSKNSKQRTKAGPALFSPEVEEPGYPVDVEYLQV